MKILKKNKKRVFILICLIIVLSVVLLSCTKVDDNSIIYNPPQIVGPSIDDNIIPPIGSNEDDNNSVDEPIVNKPSDENPDETIKPSIPNEDDNSSDEVDEKPIYSTSDLFKTSADSSILLNEGQNCSFLTFFDADPINSRVINFSLNNDECYLNIYSYEFNSDNYSNKVSIFIYAKNNSSLLNQNTKLTISSNSIVLMEIDITIANIDLPKRSEIIVNNTTTVEDGETTYLNVVLESKPDGNQEVHLSLDSNAALIDKSTLIFTESNYNIPQTIEITGNLAPTNKVDSISRLTISSERVPNKTVTISVKKKNLALFEILTPFTSGFITKPVKYFTAYYDVNFEITKMMYDVNEDSNWKELKADNDCSFTNNACMIDMYGVDVTSNPKIRLKAYYEEKIEQTYLNPTIELEGYKIKVQQGDYVEYFNPSADIPKTIVKDGETGIAIKNYKKFSRTNEIGITETFYLALREKSTSKFSIDGLCPTNFEKAFLASQDSQKKYYMKIPNWFIDNCDITNIQFVDSTNKDELGENLYSNWRLAMQDCIKTFNESFNIEGINAHISEATSLDTSNTIYCFINDEAFAGQCNYMKPSKTFSIYVNAYYFEDHYDQNIYKAEIKSVLIHEMGHLLGYNDSAYATNDSLYSYARDRLKVTYFQPNDIATLMFWYKAGYIAA